MEQFDYLQPIGDFRIWTRFLRKYVYFRVINIDFNPSPHDAINLFSCHSQHCSPDNCTRILTLLIFTVSVSCKFLIIIMLVNSAVAVRKDSITGTKLSGTSTTVGGCTKVLHI